MPNRIATTIALAGEVFRRTDTADEQVFSAYRRISRLKMTNACSDAKRAQLREIAVDYSHLLAIGYVSGDRFVCSAVSPSGEGDDMGPSS